MLAEITVHHSDSFGIIVFVVIALAGTFLFSLIIGNCNKNHESCKVEQEAMERIKEMQDREESKGKQ